MQALGTRFMVRDERGGIRVAVFEGAVAIRPAASDAQRVLQAGQQLSVSYTHLLPGEAPTFTTVVGADRGERKQVTLPDGSVLDINGNTLAEVKFYAGRREICLLYTSRCV